jgi:hypothetical protein
MAGRKVALITDTHFGVRKGSQIFHDYFESFIRKYFFLNSMLVVSILSFILVMSSMSEKESTTGPLPGQSECSLTNYLTGE